MHSVLMTLNSYRLGLAVDRCIDLGYAIEQSALFPETAGVLTDCAHRQAMSPSSELGVYQSFDRIMYEQGDWPDEIDWLVRSTERVVTAKALARARIGLSQWRVNDVSIQSYGDPAAGIGWHRDFARDKHLVVVFTVSGAAVVKVIDDNGHARELCAQSRSVLCLLGPDPISGSDPRLAHTVGPPLTNETRTSIALRMTVSP